MANIGTDRKRVLIVDDELSVLESLKLSLSKQFGLFPAVNGLAALNTLNQQKVDLIVLDLNLPIIDGETLVDILHKNANWRNIPVF